MCGVVGYFSVDGTVDERLTQCVKAARDQLTHRGPDDAGLYRSKDGHCVLGHRRLSILDTSAQGRQPMANEDETLWIVFNGEIYNFVALREELIGKGHTFRSRSDTEVILHLYEQEGPSVVHRLDGMFAFVVYDAINRRLFGARDRLGVKPLYYAKSSKRFAFASEPKALLALPDVSRDPRLTELPNYLAFNCIPGSGTLFRDIEKLEPGTMFQVTSKGEFRQEQYWLPQVYGGRQTESIDTLKNALANRLREATKKRMISDVPFGALLSGGVDSSLTVALMSEALGKPVKTFTVGYPGDEANVESDLHYARLVAKRYRTDHHETILSDSEIVSSLDDLPSLVDDPIGAPSVTANALLAKFVGRCGVTVVQVGEGADELFCGYPAVHRLWRLHDRFSSVGCHLPRSGARLLAQSLGPLLEKLGDPSLINSMDGSIAEHLRRYGRGEHLHWGYGVLFTRTHQERLFKAGSLASNPYECISRQIQKVPRFSDCSYLDQLTLIDLMVGLPERLLMRVDKATMLYGIEAREPFLDPAVLAIALRIPPVLRAESPKSVLKAVAGEMLPVEILNRRKVGFPTLHGAFLAPTVLALIREKVIHKRFLDLTGLDRDQVELFFIDADKGGRRFFYQIWSIFVLSLWFHNWVEARQ